MDIFNNFIRLFSQEPEQEVSPTATLKVPAVKSGKYDSDIKALEGEYGDLHGLHLTVDLQKLLTLCPRERRRIEAYQGLKSVLQKDYQCFLTILSQKTKK